MINYLLKHPGHKIWKWNLSTQEIAIESNVQNESSNFVSFEKQNEYWYCSALNEENAKRQFNEKAKRLYEKLNPPIQ